MPTKHPMLALLAVILAAGCGAATGDVKGTVTYKGKPVSSGTVMLLPDGGTPIYAELNPNGEFSQTGVPVGKVRVTVSSPDPARPVLARDEAKPKPLGPPDPRWFPLPGKSSDPAQSGLQYDIIRGANTLAIQLKD